jgi:hypothetical protein
MVTGAKVKGERYEIENIGYTFGHSRPSGWLGDMRLIIYE